MVLMVLRFNYKLIESKKMVPLGYNGLRKEWGEESFSVSALVSLELWSIIINAGNNLAFLF